MTTLPKHSRVVGEDRELLTKQIAEFYDDGDSIRTIAERLGRSYGNVHRMLLEAGVQVRPRGGANGPTKPQERKLTVDETRSYRERLAQVRPGRKR